MTQLLLESEMSLTNVMSDTVNIFAAIHHWCAAQLTGFFHTPVPYLFICLIVLAFFPLRLLANHESRVWRAVMRLMMVLFPLTFLVELGALLTLGFDVIWWCNPDTYGFWGALWRVCLLVLVLMVQLIAIWVFTNFMPEYLAGVSKSNESDASFNLWPAFWGLALCYPAFWVGMFAVAYFHVPTNTPLYAFFGVLGLGVAMMLARNVKTYGLLLAPVACIIGLSINIGFLAALFILGLALLKLFVYVIISCPIIVFMFYASSKYFAIDPKKEKAHEDAIQNWHNTHVGSKPWGAGGY